MRVGQFPNSGDMVIDTGENAFFADERQLRSVVLHEQGHNFGLTHVYSDDARLIMEPRFDSEADGPQLDDIRGLHRAYGDVLEKSNGGAGNDQLSLATSLGLLQPGSVISLGTDGQKDVIGPDDVDFVSIDDTFDLDFFAFDINAPILLDASVIPVGTTYLEAPNRPRSVSLMLLRSVICPCPSLAAMG